MLYQYTRSTEADLESWQVLHVPAAALPGASVVGGPLQDDGCSVPKYCGCKRCWPDVHASGVPHGWICHHQAEHPPLGCLDVLVFPYAGKYPTSQTSSLWSYRSLGFSMQLPLEYAHPNVIRYHHSMKSLPESFYPMQKLPDNQVLLRGQSLLDQIFSVACNVVCYMADALVQAFPFESAVCSESALDK